MEIKARVIPIKETFVSLHPWGFEIYNLNGIQSGHTVLGKRESNKNGEIKVRTQDDMGRPLYTTLEDVNTAVTKMGLINKKNQLYSISHQCVILFISAKIKKRWSPTKVRSLNRDVTNSRICY